MNIDSFSPVAIILTIMLNANSILFSQTLFSPIIIEDFCKSWKLKDFSVFGLVLSSDFTIESHIDIMIDCDEDTGVLLLNIARMKSELEEICKRKIDLLTHRVIGAVQIMPAIKQPLIQLRLPRR